MGSYTNYLRNKINDHLYRSATFAKPANCYWGLFTVAPTDAGGGTEVVGGAYARVNLAPSDTNYFATQGGTSGASNGTTGSTPNAVTVTFPAPSADWGTAVAIGRFDASSAGNLLEWALLTAAVTIRAGEPSPTFPPSAINPTLVSA